MYFNSHCKLREITYQSNEFGWLQSLRISGPTRESLRNAESLNRPGLATSRPQITEFTAGKPPFSKV